MTWEKKPWIVMRNFIILLQPFAPHLAEELWQKLSKSSKGDKVRESLDLAYQPWPKFDPQWLSEDTMEIPVQVNGKLRDVVRVPVGSSQSDLEAAAKAAEKVQQFIDGKTIKKIIVVPGKLVNIVVA
jgi:leucyl-tRNA synthetase